MPREFRTPDLVAILACVFILLVAATIPALSRARHKAARISCVSYLKQIGLAHRIYANDNHGLYPAAIGATNPVIRAEALAGRMPPIFQAMSNELSVPRTVICPADTRVAVTNWSLLQNSNLSYFVGLDATDTKPNVLLAGDRNLAIDGKLLSGVVPLGTNQPVSLTKDLHRQNGNIGLADGSVQQVTTLLLQQQLKHSGDATNLLVFPQ